MSEYLSFEQIKESVDMRQAAQFLGLEMTWKGDQGRSECPACQSGGNRALSVNLTKRSFYCFSARAGGDVISMVAHVNGVRQRDAAGLLHKHFLVSQRQE